MQNKRIDLISLKICKDKSLRYDDTKANNPEKAYRIIRDFIGETDREYFGVLNLDNRNNICSIEICSIGTVNTTIIHPREVFKGAIKCNSSKIILFHTHPSDSLTPSSCDISTTKDLYLISKIIEIPIVDHIIVSSNDFFSFASNGLVFG